MAKFRISQVVNCDVRVWYNVEANNHFEALAIAENTETPTAVCGCDYEIINDKEIIDTIADKIRD